MGEVEEVQEQIKADIEAVKEQMAIMMEAKISIKKIMEVNAVAIAATSTIAKVNLTPPSGLNQMNHPTSDMVGKDLGSTGNPHFVQVQNKHAFLSYGLPLNYTPPNENVNNSTPILIESQQPQFDHARVSQPMGGCSNPTSASDCASSIKWLIRHVCEVLIFTFLLSQSVGLASHPLSATLLG
ncbi:hypothetical protein GmHk_06G017115 [Glycine max]|nr:hypothetical protein GmHk_06G017115 [Glycine max]